MPLLIAVAAAVLFFVVLAVAMAPLTLFLRYRAATTRRQARGFVAGLNVAGLSLSAVLLLVTASVASMWVPTALPFTLAGFAAGGVAGLLGLALSRWESGPRALHYTPSRVLVFLVMLVVVGRIGYGLWRGWHAWHTQTDSFILAFGPAPSLAAGGLVIGYFLMFSLGVWSRLRQHRREMQTPAR